MAIWMGLLALMVFSAVWVLGGSNFQNEISWDGIITLAVFVIAAGVGVVFWTYRSWRTKHLVRADFACDPYDFKDDDSKRKFYSAWEFPVGGPFSVLLRVMLHEGATIRRLDCRFVQRSFPLPMLWRRASVETIKVDEIVDMRYSFSSSPMYYFESNENGDGSCNGMYFDGHENAKGREVAGGEAWWIAVESTGLEEWVGRLELDVVINKKRIRERKPFRIREKGPPFDMDKYPLFVEELHSAARR